MKARRKDIHGCPMPHPRTKGTTRGRIPDDIQGQRLFFKDANFREDSASRLGDLGALDRSAAIV